MASSAPMAFRLAVSMTADDFEKYRVRLKAGWVF
jgi:hypothetical protein